jgi:RNA polymerase sigma factor (sigma-70 family)
MLILFNDSYEKLSDVALIREIISGNHAAFAYLLIGRCRKRLKFLVNNDCYREMKITLDELFSEILIILKKNDFHVLRLFRGFEPNKSCTLETYISVIANRFLAKKLKKFLKEKRYKNTRITTYKTFVGNYDEKMIVELDDLLRVLSSNEKKVIDAYKLSGMSVKDVAGILGMTETNIYTIYSRAIKKLRKHFIGN